MTKITLFLILMFSFGSYGSIKAQQVTLELKNKTLQEIFREIRKQTGVHFLYEEPLLENAGKTSINVKDKNLNQLLDHLFHNKGIHYERKGNNILILGVPSKKEKFKNI